MRDHSTVGRRLSLAAGGFAIVFAALGMDGAAARADEIINACSQD